MPNGPAKFTRSEGRDIHGTDLRMWIYWNSQGAMLARVTEVYPTFSGSSSFRVYLIPVYVAELLKFGGSSPDPVTPAFYAAGWYKTFRQADKVIKDLLLKGDK